jgi:predicted enzyme related to lactoylglutathione lyase
MRAGCRAGVDLATPDPEASKAFYAELFGWTYTDDPTGLGPSMAP